MGPMLQALGPLKTMLVVAAVLACAAGVVLCSAFVGRFLLAPLNRRAERLRGAIRFQLSDFFWLLVQLQLALGYSVSAVGVEQTFYFLLVTGFLVLAAVGMWAGAVSYMSRAGVTEPRRRAVFILFLLPLALTTMIVVSMVAVIAPCALFIDRITGHPILGPYLREAVGESFGPIGVVTLGLTVVATVAALRRTAAWLVADAAPAGALSAEPFDSPADSLAR